MEDPINATSDYIQPYATSELLRLIDKAIRYASKTTKLTHRGGDVSMTLPHPAYTFFVTSNFEKGLKRLKKTYRIEAINTLKNAIIKLSVYGTLVNEPENGSIEGKVKKLEIDDEGSRLLYGVIPGAKLSLSVSNSTDKSSQRRCRTDVTFSIEAAEL